MLNLSDYVTPNHFSAGDFDEWDKLPAQREFDLIAPITVYFRADLEYKKEARAALTKLKQLSHPMVEGKTVAEMLEDEPDGLVSRYNALMMAIVEDLVPGTESYIDPYGAFSFKIGDNDSAFMGDSSGFFAFYVDAKSVVKYVRELYGQPA